MFPSKVSMALRDFLVLYFVLFLFPYIVTGAAVQPSIERQTSPLDNFTFESLQPSSPASSIKTSYNFVEEVSAWSDLSVLYQLIISQPLIAESPLLNDAILLFAPTNNAFISVLGTLVPGSVFEETPETIAAELAETWRAAQSVNPDIPDLPQVLLYHIIEGDFPEEDIVSGSPLESLQGENVATSAYPTMITDVDGSRSISRLGRQLEPSNGRISFIDKVLLPFELSLFGDFLAEGSSTRQTETGTNESLFTPFTGVVNLVDARKDLVVLRTLLVETDLVDALAEASGLHVLAPTNQAFINLIEGIVTPEVASVILPPNGTNTILDSDELVAFAGRIVSFFVSLESGPSLADVLIYHVLPTLTSFNDLDGAGPQGTLFLGNTVEIESGIVMDANEDTGAALVSSFATQTGFVSIIDSVLVPAPLLAALSPSSEDDPPEPSPEILEEVVMPPSGPGFAGDIFSNNSIQPVVPAAAIESSYNLVQELTSWSDLSVLVALVLDVPGLLDDLLAEAPLLLFAPTNDAFATLARLLNPDLPEELTPEDLVAALRDIWEDLPSSLPEAPILKDVLKYHVLRRSLAEPELRDAFRPATLFERSVGTRDYPNRIFDRNSGPPRSGRRLGRQISNTNARISIVSAVLLPFDIPADLSRFAVTARQPMPRDDTLFSPLESIVNFVAARNDLRVLLRLVIESDLVDALSTESILHVFAPTNSAFITLVKELVPEALLAEVGLPEDETDAEELDEFAVRVNVIWSTLSGIPSIAELLTYHVLPTTSGFDTLIEEGPQRTLFNNNASTFDLSTSSEITVTSNGVQDADPTSDAGKIASFTTRNGFVTIIDDVLLPFTAEEATELVQENLGIGPSDLLEESSEPGDLELLDGPEATSEVETPEPTPDDEDEDSEGGAPTGDTSNGEDDDPVCFPSSAKVTLSNGNVIRMHELVAGHEVHVGDGTSSPIFLFTHKQTKVLNVFTRITTKLGHEIALTPSHYLYANGYLTAAKAVLVGDMLDTTSGMDVVVKTETVKMSGLHAPHTVHGDMVVDGVRVSGYSTAIHPRLAHALLAPVRVFVKWTGIREPLGSTFYGGARRIANMMPSGSLRH